MNNLHVGMLSFRQKDTGERDSHYKNNIREVSQAYGYENRYVFSYYSIDSSSVSNAVTHGAPLLGRRLFF